MVFWGGKPPQVIPFGVSSMHWAPHVFRAVDLHTVVTARGALTRLFIVEADGTEVDVLDVEVSAVTSASPHLRISAFPH